LTTTITAGYAHVKNEVLQAPFFNCRGHKFLPVAQRKFNVRMARLRVTVEWMFKDITCTWRYLKFKLGLRIRQQPVGMFYIVGAELTNVLTCMIGHSQSSLYFGCPPPTLEEYLQPRVFAVGLGLPPPQNAAADAAVIDQVLADNDNGVDADDDAVVDAERLGQVILAVPLVEDDSDDDIVDDYGAVRFDVAVARGAQQPRIGEGHEV
jgi:hypothetical protein